MAHFPVRGWLRVIITFIKQQASTVTNRWDDEIKDVCLCCMLMETVAKMDPVRGDWCVDGSKMKVWIDASSVATGVLLKVNRSIVEDACWLHPSEDAKHINLAELNAAIKGINFNGGRWCYIWLQIWHACVDGYLKP